MKFGVQHAMGDPAWKAEVLHPRAVTEFCRVAEEVGFDAVAFTDHPAPSVRWLDSGGEGVADLFTCLGFCAAVTEHMRLMPFVFVPTYRNPLLAAHQFATLDLISNGRLTIACGTGYLFSEFHALGSDPKRRLQLWDEHVDVMRRAWSGEEVTVDGTGFSARGVKMLPPVVQRPHPPLWIHGNSPWGLERAARIGQGWLGMMTHGNEVVVRTTRTTALDDINDVGKRIDELKVAADAHGRDPEDIEVAIAGAFPMIDARKGWSVERYLDDVGRLEALGVQWILVNCCGDDAQAAHDTVRQFGEDIVQGSRRI